jgi:hypothetical protein
MIAAPIIPGRLYRVHHRGQSLIVIAPDPCTAIVIGLARLVCSESLPCAA